MFIGRSPSISEAPAGRNVLSSLPDITPRWGWGSLWVRSGYKHCAPPGLGARSRRAAEASRIECHQLQAMHEVRNLEAGVPQDLDAVERA